MTHAEPASVPAAVGATASRSPWSRFFLGRTLGECLDARRDNILHLRLLAAAAVVMGHAGLGGSSQIPYDFIHALLPATYMHVLGLIMFFTISGFLITHSYQRRPELLRFLWARALRIWPALAACAVAVAFVLGPFVTKMPLATYLSPQRPDGPYGYVASSMSVFWLRGTLDGLFDGPVSKLANGPLWTIPVEATMYLWVGAAGVLRLLRLRWLTSFGIATVFFVLLLWPMMTGPFETLNTKLSLQGFFGAGMIACLLRRYIPVSTGIMLLVAIACVAMRTSIHTTPFIWLAIFYFVFWFSYVPRLPRIPGNLDLSYGLYLWGWPIQQTLAVAFHVVDAMAIFALTLVIGLSIAAVSWIFVEQPALRFKEAFRGFRALDVNAATARQ